MKIIVFLTLPVLLNNPYFQLILTEKLVLTNKPICNLIEIIKYIG